MDTDTPAPPVTEQRATFTPGPWRVDDGDTSLRVRATQRPWHCVALVTGGVDAADIETPHGPVYQANARLIAAAPSLYAALKELLADIEDYQSRNHLGGHDNHAQVMARAALARAEGQ